MTRVDHKGIGMTSQRTRDRLIQRLREHGVDDERVLAVLRDTPRHLFVDEALASRAYEDSALPIGFGQTISQPYIVARMTAALIKGTTPRKVLEVGSGSGYQTAVLAQLVEQVHSVERIEGLLRIAERRLRDLGLRNVCFKRSDGSWGWKQHAPFDGILVTAAPLEIPQELLQQLADGGRMVIPVGAAGSQKLMLLTRQGQTVTQELLENVSFVPLVTGDRP
jgi:protein-L-isoaspartate(D-aspartate) O-methyltransferase